MVSWLAPEDIRRVAMDAAAQGHVAAYAGRAKTLRDSRHVNELVATLQDLLLRHTPTSSNTECHKSPPFVVLDNSSGTGKTQMAFNLMARIGDDVADVHYVVCDQDDGFSSRPPTHAVYKAFASQTAAFKSCLYKDKRAFGNGSVATIQAIAQPLWTYGFIYAMVAGDATIDGPKTHADVTRVLEQRANPTKPCVFFLDAFPRREVVAYTTEVDAALAIRDVFRVLFPQVVLVTSSTGETARNGKWEPCVSEGAARPLWCVVHPSLPPFRDDDVATVVPVALQPILFHSRPLFAQMALRYMRRQPPRPTPDGSWVAYLDEMVGALAHQLVSWEGIFSDFFGVGQVALFLDVPLYTAKNRNVVFAHYARLEATRPFRLYRTKCDTNCTEDGKWRGECAFPPPEEDVLLHLVLTGGKVFRALQDPPQSGEPGWDHSMWSRLKELWSAPGLSYANSNQVFSDDGWQTRVLVPAAIVHASHIGGFAGVTLSAFLPALLFELGIGSTRAKTVVEYPDEEVTRFAQQTRVPFLGSPRGHPWPAFLTSSSSLALNLVSLVRPGNRDPLDLRASDDCVSAECKAFGTALTLSMVKSMLERVPPGSKVHLVVTNTLQKTEAYFTRPEFAAFVAAKQLAWVDTARFLRLVADPTTGSLRLHAMEGMDGSTRAKRKRGDEGDDPAPMDKLVLFVELELRQQH